MRHAVGAMSVARVLSQAPPSLRMTPKDAAALLRRNCGSVSRSVKAARRQAAGDASVMQPVPEPGTDFQTLDTRLTPAMWPPSSPRVSRSGMHGMLFSPSLQVATRPLLLRFATRFVLLSIPFALVEP